MASALCQKCFLKTRFFVKQLKILYSFDHTILFTFIWHVVQTFFKECMERLQTSNVSTRIDPWSALATVAGKSFNGKFAPKTDFSIGYFMLLFLMLILKSLHTLFDKYLDHMLVKFEQNSTVRTIKKFELFDKNG